MYRTLLNMNNVLITRHLVSFPEGTGDLGTPLVSINVMFVFKCNCRFDSDRGYWQFLLGWVGEHQPRLPLSDGKSRTCVAVYTMLSERKRPFSTWKKNAYTAKILNVGSSLLPLTLTHRH